MTTSVYTFNVRRGVATCLLMVGATNRDDAIEQAKAIEPEHAVIEFAHKQSGTLEDFLGEETMKRIAYKYKHNRTMRQRKLDKARHRVIETAAGGGK